MSVWPGFGLGNTLVLDTGQQYYKLKAEPRKTLKTLRPCKKCFIEIVRIRNSSHSAREHLTRLRNKGPTVSLWCYVLSVLSGFMYFTFLIINGPFTVTKEIKDISKLFPIIAISFTHYFNPLCQYVIMSLSPIIVE